MGDVKDILGLNKATASTSAEASTSKKEKARESVRERPKGLSREAFNLLYGQHPIAPCRLLSEVAKKEEPKTTSSAQVTYQFVPFNNEARNDDLQLYHWVQCYKDATGATRPADDGPYPFAKYNSKAGAYRYDDVEYETIVRPALPESETGWSKEETDYLLDLCELLDLRFLIIADRWDFPDGAKRSVEDLKEHYYAVAHELAVARAGDKVLASSNPIVRTPYDAQKERERKECLQLSLGRKQQQAADDDIILAQAELIQQKRKEQAAARRPQGTPLQNPTSYSNSVLELPFFDHTLTAYAPPKPGVYSRRAMLEDAIKRAGQQVQSSQRVQKLLETVMGDTPGGGTMAQMPTRAVSGMFLSLYIESLAVSELKLNANRPVIRPDEGRGKRAIKVKAPRYDDEASLPPANKRNRAR